MSAELYDAEMAGALARPAIDVLPTQNSRKGKAEESVPAPSSAVEAPVEAPFDAPTETAAPEPAGRLPAPVDLPAAAVPAASPPPRRSPRPRSPQGLRHGAHP